MSEVLIPTPKEFIKTQEAAKRKLELAPTYDGREVVRTSESAPRPMGEATLKALSRWEQHVAASEVADDFYDKEDHYEGHGFDDEQDVDSGMTFSEQYAEELNARLRNSRKQAVKRGSGYDDDPEDLDRMFGDYDDGVSFTTPYVPKF